VARTRCAAGTSGARSRGNGGTLRWSILWQLEHAIAKSVHNEEAFKVLAGTYGATVAEEVRAGLLAGDDPYAIDACFYWHRELKARLGALA
jgi:hypothetical protein